MKKTIKIFTWIVIAEILFISLMSSLEYLTQVKYVRAQEVEVVEKELTTHAQKVWISALEWCESRGRPEAINKVDRDGTPSYYSFQFKPSTFRGYAEKYSVIEKGLGSEVIMEKMKDQKIQYSILENMVNDKKVKWEREFPDCVKNKIGKPPVY